MTDAKLRRWLEEFRLTVNNRMPLSDDYKRGWNDCVAAMVYTVMNEHTDEPA